MNRFYSKEATFGPVCEVTAKVFDQTISTFANSGKKVLRVLEIGAGEQIFSGILSESYGQNLMIRRNWPSNSLSLSCAGKS